MSDIIPPKGGTGAVRVSDRMACGFYGQQPAPPPFYGLLAEQVRIAEAQREAALDLLGNIIATLSLPVNVERIKSWGKDAEHLLSLTASWTRSLAEIEAMIPRPK